MSAMTPDQERLRAMSSEDLLGECLAHVANAALGGRLASLLAELAELAELRRRLSAYAMPQARVEWSGEASVPHRGLPPEHWVVMRVIGASDRPMWTDTASVHDAPEDARGSLADCLNAITDFVRRVR
jgi:hypothetical protein